MYRTIIAAMISVYVCCYARAELVEINSFAAPGNAVQLEYSPKFDLLFLKNTNSAIRVLDATTGVQIDLRLSNYNFHDMDLVPGTENYLYAADFGGVRIGYGTPVNPHYVHRFNLSTRTWDSQVAPKVAWNIEAVNDNQILLHEMDQHVDMTLNLYGDTIIEQKRVGANYRGNIAYDPNYGRAYHGNSGSSSSEIHAYQVVGDTIIGKGGTGTYGSAQSGGGTAVISTDGERFYYGCLQVEALDITNNLNMFPERIYAATAKHAFGSSGYYDPETAELLGDLGFSTSVYALSQDGMHVWAFDPATDTLHHFNAIPEPSSLSLLCLGAVALLGFGRSRRKPVGAREVWIGSLQNPS